MSRCRRSLRATRAPCLAKSDQGERRGGGGSGTAGHPAVCRPAPHGKAHFVGFGGVAECAFRSRRRLGGVEPNPPPACGALWKMAQLGKCARATPPPGCGGVAPVNDLCSWPKGCLRRFAGMPMGSMQGYINWCVYPFRVNKAGDGWPKAPRFPKTHDVAGGS